MQGWGREMVVVVEEVEEEEEEVGQKEEEEKEGRKEGLKRARGSRRIHRAGNGCVSRSKFRGKNVFRGM